MALFLLKVGGEGRPPLCLQSVMLWFTSIVVCVGNVYMSFSC